MNTPDRQDVPEKKFLPLEFKENKPYFFLSYCHKDTGRIADSVDRLIAEGCNFWDDELIAPGRDWDTEIAKHVKGCAGFICFISQDYLKSENCMDELFYARDQAKNCLLVYLDPVRLPEGLQLRLNRKNAVELFRYDTKTGVRRMMLTGFIREYLEEYGPQRHAEPEPVKRAGQTAARSHSPAAKKPSAPRKKQAPRRKSGAGLAAGICVLLILLVLTGIVAGRLYGSGTQAGQPRASSAPTPVQTAEADITVETPEVHETPSPSAEPTAQPSPESTAEPTAEPVPEATSEPAAEFTPEPSPEVTVAP